jgi:hypothetical protein
MPQDDSGYDEYFRNLNQVVAQKCSSTPPVWVHIPQAAQTALANDYIAWHALYLLTRGAHTSLDTAEKNRVKEATKKRMRDFIKGYIRYHPAVTNAERDECRVHNDDTTRTPIGVPKTRPEFNIEVKDIRTLSIPFHDQGTESRAIPYGLDGAVIRSVVMDRPATSVTELTRKSVLATSSPYTMVFTDEERGKIVSVALTWQNEKGEEGKSSEIQWAVIP